MAPTGRLTFLLFFTLVTLSASLKIDDLDALETGMAEFIHTGNPSPDFRKLLQSNQFPHVFRENMALKHVFDMPQVCYYCNLVVDLVIEERYLGLSRETLYDEAVILCKDLNIETDRVCRGAIDLNIDIFLYIIDNYPNITSNRICGSVLQSYGCPTGPAFQWSIDIPVGSSPDRAQPNDTNAPSFTILQLSDIHFDTEYLPNGNAACGEPICCQSDQGDPASPEDACGYWTDYRDADAPWHLVEESIRQAKTQDFDYVYYTGDIISHRIWSTSIENNTADITKLYNYFKEQFDVPVFPVFGNHEPHPLNLWPSDKVNDSFSVRWLLELAAEHWSDLIGQDVSETVLKGGYYSVSPRPGFRVIGINSNLGYIDNWWLIFDDVDPFNQLQWLAGALKEAEDNGESVHILSHVPSGSGDNLEDWSIQFGKIIERFANTITAIFNGHTHKDQFHVYYNSTDRSQPIAVAVNGASITPFSHSNPSFKYYYVDESTFYLLDYDEWYFNLTLANSLGEGSPVDWQILYSFNEAYGSQSLIPSEVDKVLHRMTEDHTLLDDFFNFYYRAGDAGIQGGCDDNCKRGNLCNIATTVFGTTDRCDYFLSLYDQ